MVGTVWQGGRAMMAMARMIGVVIALELVFFVLIRIWLRSLQRERMENRWDARHPEAAGDSPARREFVRKSMVGFERTLRARLVWLVFVLPTLAIAAIIYYVNWQ